MAALAAAEPETWSVSDLELEHAPMPVPVPSYFHAAQELAAVETRLLARAPRQRRVVSYEATTLAMEHGLAQHMTAIPTAGVVVVAVGEAAAASQTESQSSARGYRRIG